MELDLCVEFDSDLHVVKPHSSRKRSDSFLTSIINDEGPSHHQPETIPVDGHDTSEMEDNQEDEPGAIATNVEGFDDRRSSLPASNETFSFHSNLYHCMESGCQFAHANRSNRLNV